jgi:PTH1 family peptidyl-tRNA hydrolase
LIQSLATQAFPRVRVGVGRGDHRRDLADHVLGRFEADERDTVSAAVLRAADATEMFLSEGIGRVMNAFNAAEKEDSAE